MKLVENHPRISVSEIIHHIPDDLKKTSPILTPVTLPLGTRYYFKCLKCGLRVEYLYSTESGQYLCRYCVGLKYERNVISKKARKIRAQLKKAEKEAAKRLLK
jgi:hypothetical protein